MIMSTMRSKILIIILMIMILLIQTYWFLINYLLTETADFFGEVAILRDQPRTSSAIATTNKTVIICIDRLEFLHLLSYGQNHIDENFLVEEERRFNAIINKYISDQEIVNTVANVAFPGIDDIVMMMSMMMMSIMMIMMMMMILWWWYCDDDDDKCKSDLEIVNTVSSFAFPGHILLSTSLLKWYLFSYQAFT